MGFSLTSQYIRLETNYDTDETWLCAECKNEGNWQLTSACLDKYIGVTQESEGFDTTQGKSASDQGKTLRSLLVPGSLTLKGGSVLCGKVREEFGGWKTSIYLDILFSSEGGVLGRQYWSNCLVASAVLLGASEDGKSLRGLLLGSNGKLTASELLLAGNCEYFDVCGQHGLRPGSDSQVVSYVSPYLSRGELNLTCGLTKNYGLGYDSGSVSCREYLSNLEGKLSMERPEACSEDFLNTVTEEFQKQLANVGFTLAGEEALNNMTTRATALCIYNSVMTCGAVLGRIFCGQLITGYTPALAFMAGSAIKSAAGPFVGNRTMGDEIAAVAIYRVLKAELPAITGMSVKEVLGMANDLRCYDCTEDEEYLSPYKDFTQKENERRQLDGAIFTGAMDGWARIITSVNKALTKDMSEDDLKHEFDDKTHDGVDLLNPPPTGEEEAYLCKWMQDVRDVQDQLYLVEPDVGGAVEESAEQALKAITNGLAGLNELLEFWPDYKGDDETNKQRLAIIQSASELIAKGKRDVKETDEDTSVLDKVLAIEERLNGLKVQFMEETTAEQAELNKIKPELQTAVQKMFADQKLYQSAQNELVAKLKEIGDEEHKHGAEPTIDGGIRWYKDFLRRRTSALETNQSAADLVSATYLASERNVVDLQGRQAVLNSIHKRRFSVEREISKAEMIIRCLKLMIEGTKREEDRILSVVGLLSTTLDELAHIGAPPYHRQDRKIEDQLCTAVLKAHRESLIDSSFVKSARNAVTEIQGWFDDGYVPKSVQEEIAAIVNNPLYKASS